VGVEKIFKFTTPTKEINTMAKSTCLLDWYAYVGNAIKIYMEFLSSLPRRGVNEAIGKKKFWPKSHSGHLESQKQVSVGLPLVLQESC
jgi:hypothetical protein